MAGMVTHVECAGWPHVGRVRDLHGCGGWLRMVDYGGLTFVVRGHFSGGGGSASALTGTRWFGGG
jgi:hypothetical protein